MNEICQSYLKHQNFVFQVCVCGDMTKAPNPSNRIHLLRYKLLIMGLKMLKFYLILFVLLQKYYVL